MKTTFLTHRFVRLAIAAATVALVTATAVSAQQGATYEIVSSFDGIYVEGVPPEALIEGRDGNFYGTTRGEGRFGAGTLFKIDAAGVLTTLHHFAVNDGLRPVAIIQAADGSLYGITQLGGAFGVDMGTIFRWDATGGLTTVHHFSPEDGTTQPTVLIEGREGTIYGATESTVFRLDPAGVITTLHRFEEAEGAVATALLQAPEGSLYGTMRDGGPFDEGTVFKLDTNGTLTLLHTFSGPDGSEPLDVIQGSDGDFYGVTGQGSIPNRFGTIFKIDAAGTFTTLHRFPNDTFASVLIQGSDGSFYGSRSGRDGFIFRFDPALTLTPLHTFTRATSGTSSAAVIQASNGNLYGTDPSGVVLGDGMVFTLDLTGTFAVLHRFIRNPGPAHPVAPVTEGSDGRLYGTTVDGGPSNVGTVFAIEPSGTSSILHTFAGNDGAFPRAGLAQATDGRLYGTTTQASTGAGTVFAIDATGALTTVYRFQPVLAPPPNPSGNGSPPNGLIQATDGLLWGTTNLYVFSLPLSGPVTIRGNQSGDSDAALVQASDGTLFGTTGLLGSLGPGTHFQRRCVRRGHDAPQLQQHRRQPAEGPIDRGCRWEPLRYDVLCGLFRLRNGLQIRSIRHAHHASPFRWVRWRRAVRGSVAGE